MELPQDILLYNLIPVTYAANPMSVGSLLSTCKAAQATEQAKEWRDFLLTPAEKRSFYAARINHTQLYLLCARIYPRDENAFTLAAGHGNLTILQSVRNLRNSNAIYLAAAGGGQVGVLEWLGSLEGKSLKTLPVRKKLLHEAARKGHVCVLQWCLKEGIKVPKNLLEKVENLSFLEWCYNYAGNHFEWTLPVCLKFLPTAPLEFLIGLLDVQSTKDAIKICQSAANSGRLDVLEHYTRRFTVTDSEVSLQAVKTGNLEMLDWMLEQGYEISRKHFSEAVKAKNFAATQLLFQKARIFCFCQKVDVKHLVSTEDLPMLKWLIEHGADYDLNLFRAAIAEKDNQDTLHFLRSLDPPCPWDESVLICALKANQIEVLYWAIQEGCPVSSGLLAKAAALVDPTLLKFLVKRGVNIDPKTILSAAQQGRLENIRYLRSFKDKPTSWSKEVVSAAIQNGHIELAKWCIENGCHIDKYTFKAALKHGNEDFLNWFAPYLLRKDDAFQILLFCDVKLLAIYLENGYVFSEKDCAYLYQKRHRYAKHYVLCKNRLDWKTKSKSDRHSSRSSWESSEEEESDQTKSWESSEEEETKSADENYSIATLTSESEEESA